MCFLKARLYYKGGHKGEKNMLDKIFNQITLRCLFSIFIGAVVVTLFSGLLSLYGETANTFAEITDQAGTPQSEQSMQDLSNRLSKGAEVLSLIAPASGR
jgi:hypothetical protein